jgi:hypothetical protein
MAEKKRIKGKVPAAIVEAYDTVPPYRDPRMTGPKYRKYLRGLKDVKDKADLKKSTFIQRRITLGGVGSQAAKAAKATKIGKIAAGVAGAALATKVGLEKLYEKRTGKKPFTKREKRRTLVDKKMGGGLTEATRKLRAQGLKTGGSACRGMGAALRGGDFKGVK